MEGKIIRRPPRQSSSWPAGRKEMAREVIDISGFAALFSIHPCLENAIETAQ